MFAGLIADVAGSCYRTHTRDYKPRNMTVLNEGDLSKKAASVLTTRNF